MPGLVLVVFKKGSREDKDSGFQCKTFTPWWLF